MSIAASGDGDDQSDMIAFLGLYNAGQKLGTLGPPDPSIRSDQIVIPLSGGSQRLTFIACPFAPFVGSNQQNVCSGL